MTRRYVLTNAAARDLDTIWDYTADTWSTDQAERYVADIGAACEGLARGDRTGRPADDIRAGYQKLAVGSHVLFFRVRPDDVIEIVRVLHQSMDFHSHL